MENRKKYTWTFRFGNMCPEENACWAGIWKHF